ncbi:MAG: alpha-amylase [Lachnospiraceae bacterium]|nr:alpha-amylase [Lachnospiraceae bacterium]
MKYNETMMQYFEWYLPNDGLWWKRCAAKAENLAALGVTEVWLPPAYKGISQDDVGYGVYDMYDLGEFDQKDTVRTKYGTKEEYLEAINSFHEHGIRVLADIVLNHRMGGDELENVTAVTDSAENRNLQVGGKEKIQVWSKFTFPGRNGVYSDFVWDHRHFSGTDWAENREDEDDRIYRFTGKRWKRDTDPENGNFDYLMGMNVDMGNPQVIEETKKWLNWYLETTGIDGFRLDAVKHISFSFYRNLLRDIREKTGKKLPAVGEYWSGDIGRLLNYLDEVENEMSLFDVALHYNFFNASQAGGGYDMRHIFDNTLAGERPERAVTFVDNHDTQYGQSLQSFIEDWFKPIAYALILLRSEGIPCVFYSDYYGNPVQNRPLVPNLGKLIKTRNAYAYGEQEDYFDDEHLIGWVRRGDEEHPDSGLAVLLSNADGGTKRMYMGGQYANETFCDAIGNCQESVVIDEEGWGEFRTEGGNVAVWVRKNAFENLIINE